VTPPSSDFGGAQMYSFEVVYWREGASSVGWGVLNPWKEKIGGKNC